MLRGVAVSVVVVSTTERPPQRCNTAQVPRSPFLLLISLLRARAGPSMAAFTGAILHMGLD
ncbi:hypothetical protein ASE31_16580 [Acidovorax sp. Root217]|nr:hypothetical protein ASE31_16580 [Acidovorax sp. Root217]